VPLKDAKTVADMVAILAWKVQVLLEVIHEDMPGGSTVRKV